MTPAEHVKAILDNATAADTDSWLVPIDLEKRIAAALREYGDQLAAEEREACALVAETAQANEATLNRAGPTVREALRAVAKTIRMRGEV